MNEKSPLANLVNFGLILATVGWGVVAIHSRLDSSRPSDTVAASRNGAESQPQKVWSRLWQDPFESFDSLTNEDKSTPIAEWKYLLGAETKPLLRPKATNPDRGDSAPGGGSFWTNITTNHPNTAGTISILGVMLPGGPYAEDKEVRMRLRYAVELALLTKNLGPEDGTHIFTNAISLSTDVTNSHIAFEWFIDDTNKNQQVCALWLNEDDFAGDCVRKLNSKLRGLALNASFYLIGPRSSDTLQDIAHDTEAAPVLVHLASQKRFEILSPEATAGTFARTSHGNLERGVARAINASFPTRVFHDWIATDAKLAELIADEVTNRVVAGLSLSGSDNVVAIITEQDTLYGRTIADALSISFAQKQACGHTNNVWQFSYLRGLDGSKPRKDKTQEQSRETQATPEGTLETILQKQMQGEHANGDAQLDYIIRLGAFLKERDKALQADGRRRIIAVGVTGSDVYDKLILLQGLRSKLPEAVFFTTDLDAALCDRTQFKYTHNLLVASGYSLSPYPTNSDSRFVEQFPPFRDVYQAAVFRACQAVAYDRQSTPNSPERLGDLDARDRHGHLYVIGRNGPVELKTPAAASREAKSSRPSLLDVPIGAFFGFAITLAWGWLFRGLRPRKPGTTSAGPSVPPPELSPATVTPSTVRYAEEADRDNRAAPVVLLIGAGVGGLLGFFGWAAETIAGFAGEEPWNFNGGVSIWPCEFLRLSAAITAALLLWYAYKMHGRHRRRLWCEYFGKDYDSPNLRGEPTWASLDCRVKYQWDKFWKKGRRECLRALRDRDHPIRTWWKTYVSNWKTRWEGAFPARPPGSSRTPPAPPAGRFHPWRWWLPLVHDENIHPDKASLDAESLCKEYVRLGLLPARFARLLTAFVSYLGVALLAFWLLCGHGAPTLLLIRGPLSHTVDSVVLMAAIVPSLFLLFYVLDAARHTARFLESLSRHPTRWPENLLHEKAAKKGLQERHLDGWLDVDFAAVHTEEVGKVMFAPFFIPLLLLLSRSSFFDDWTWPPGLAAIFAVNFLLAGTSWALVRRAARAVREAALAELEDHLEQVKASHPGLFDVPTPQGVEESLRQGWNAVQTITLATDQYVRRLKSLRKEIRGENRGAYANWFQDPTYFALFIPTGITGILSVLAEFWLTK